MKATVLTTIKHNGQHFVKGDIFEGDEKTVRILVTAGALSEPEASEEAVEAPAEAPKAEDEKVSAKSSKGDEKASSKPKTKK